MSSIQEPKWKCNQCGNCCKIFKFPVQDTENVKAYFKEHFGFELKTWNMDVVVSGECEHLKENKCSIYGQCPWKKSKEYFCKKHRSEDIPEESIYQKRCRVCDVVRKFQKGTERDKQSVCGNCWEWL